MRWLQINVALDYEAIEAVTEIMLRHGLAGVEIDDPRLLMERQSAVGDWDYVEIPEGYDAEAEIVLRSWLQCDASAFDTLRTIEQEIQLLPEYGLRIGSGKVTSEVIEDQNWAEAWKAHFKPLRVGKRLVIKPAWEEWPGSGDIVIALDPGLAFGTGSHATTRICLLLLEHYLPDDASVLDVGCGSGILTVAALKLGALHVEAVDIDQLAVESTQANLALNGLADQVLVRRADLLQYSTATYDLVLANIVADAILRLLGDISRILKANGLLICSGIITERQAEIVEALNSAGFTVVDIRSEGDWVGIAARFQPRKNRQSTKL